MKIARTLASAIAILVVCCAPVLAEEAEANDPDWNVSQHLESLEVPKHIGHPDFVSVSTYLDMFTAEHLKKYYGQDGKPLPGVKPKVGTLFLACRKVTIQQKQDRFIQIHRPIMKLLAEFYPEIMNIQREPDGGVRLSNITQVIREVDEREKNQ